MPGKSHSGVIEAVVFKQTPDQNAHSGIISASKGSLTPGGALLNPTLQEARIANCAGPGGSGP
ncbi:MAG: hypothetical protein DBX00_07950 [Verrucomicrobia bacterium]|nr:MAG: hypothetical protein DBX00_07950 [Verrucomicrobiota bacterium]